MPNRKSRGSMIRLASRGKLSLRRAKARTTVLASTKARALLMQRRAASLNHERQTFHCPISLYRKLSTFDHGRSHLEQNREWKISCVQCRQPTQGTSQREHNSTLEKFKL